MSFENLLKYLPNDKALDFIKKWTATYSLQLQVRRSRKGKLGDYRSLSGKYSHRITINYDLVPELFFLTLTHEIAHMKVYDKFSFKEVKPHGKEWKKHYGNMIMESIEVYSKELQPLLTQFAKNPKAGYYSETSLVQYFSKKVNPSVLLLQQLEEGNTFSIENTVYQLIEKKRTRYLCIHLQTQKKYLINHATGVQRIETK